MGLVGTVLVFWGCPGQQAVPSIFQSPEAADLYYLCVDGTATVPVLFARAPTPRRIFKPFHSDIYRSSGRVEASGQSPRVDLVTLSNAYTRNLLNLRIGSVGEGLQGDHHCPGGNDDSLSGSHRGQMSRRRVVVEVVMGAGWDLGSRWSAYSGR